MRCDRPLQGLILGVLGILGMLALMRPGLAQDPARAPSEPLAMPAIGVVVPGDCWRATAADTKLEQHLASCAKLGADLLRLQLKPDAAQGVAACATPGLCSPLADALAAQPAPKLLLETPVALLDAVQLAVAQAHAAERVLVAPQCERPLAAAPRLLAPGVRYWVEQRSQPRPMMLHVVALDLRQPGAFEFVSTLPVPAQKAPGAAHFAVEKTSAFAQRMGLLVAVNATYFLPFDGGRLLSHPYVPQEGALATVAEAHLQGEGAAARYASSDDARVDGVVCVRPSGFAIERGACPAGSQLAFAAGPVLLAHGERLPLLAHDATQAPDASGVPAYYGHPEPRTALGLDRVGHRAWIVVVDGRQRGYSEGISLPELSRLFSELGATDAINLDGGGSSTLVLQGQVVNSPIHTSIPGRERPVAKHFGLRIVPASSALQP